MTAPKLTLSGFWSYSRRDDPDALEALHLALQEEISKLLGRNFVIWRDRVEIAFGRNFKIAIRNGLANAEIFIPIITPSWLHSPYCREEYSAFAELSRHQSQRRHVFPVYYIEIGKIDLIQNMEMKGVADEVFVLQHQDWRQLRLTLLSSGVNHPDVFRQIHELALEISDAIREMTPSHAVAINESAADSQTTQSPEAHTLQLEAQHQRQAISAPLARKRVAIPQGRRNRPNGPARLELSIGGNSKVDTDRVELKIGVEFTVEEVETKHYVFNMGVKKARLLVDPLQADIDPDKCVRSGTEGMKDEVTTRRNSEWVIESLSDKCLSGDYFPGGPICELMNCGEAAGASARLVAKTHDLVIQEGSIRRRGRALLPAFSHPNQERLVSIWLQERLGNSLGGTKREVVLHEQSVETNLIDDRADHQ